MKRAQPPQTGTDRIKKSCLWGLWNHTHAADTQRKRTYTHMLLTHREIGLLQGTGENFRLFSRAGVFSL